MQLFANVLACDNGMTSAKSLLSFDEKHNGTLIARFAAMELKMLINLQTQIEEMNGLVAKLDNQNMTRNEVEVFANRLFPAQDEEDVSTRTQNMREAIIVGFSRGAGNVGRTRWDAFNSVTEYMDHFSTFRATDYSAQENRFESLTTGGGAKLKARALEMLLN